MLNRHVEHVLRLINSLEEEERTYLIEYFQNAPLSVFEQTEILRMKGGKTFIYEEEKNEKIYILVKGIVKATDRYRDDMSFEYMRFKPIKVFGTMELLLDMDVYKTSLTTMTECYFLVISRSAFEKWLIHDAQVLRLEAKAMGTYLLMQAKTARAYLFLDGKQRVMAHITATVNLNLKDDRLRLPRQTIAENTGLSVRTVNRAVKELEEEGYITCKGRDFYINEEQRSRLKHDTEEFWQNTGL